VRGIAPRQRTGRLGRRIGLGSVAGGRRWVSRWKTRR